MAGWLQDFLEGHRGDGDKESGVRGGGALWDQVGLGGNFGVDGWGRHDGGGNRLEMVQDEGDEGGWRW